MQLRYPILIQITGLYYAVTAPVNYAITVGWYKKWRCHIDEYTCE